MITRKKDVYLILINTGNKTRKAESKSRKKKKQQLLEAEIQIEAKQIPATERSV